MRRAVLCALLSLSSSLAPAHAVDGVIEINQARALAGGVTPGDSPGFPVTLDRRGSYRLTGEIDVTAGPAAADVTAILITSSFVTLDLNGFSIVGPTVCSGSPVSSCAPTGNGRGIDSSAANFVRIHDGSVWGFGRDGVFAGHATVERLEAFSNGNLGIGVQFGGRVVDSTAIANGNMGIWGGGLLVRASRALENRNSGIYVFPGEVRDSEVVHNGGGVQADDGLVVGTIARGNVHFAIAVPGGGYASNLLSGSPNLIIEGVALSSNLCDGAVCP
jgi:hypothetical protein